MHNQAVLPRQVIALGRSTIGKKAIMAVTGLIWIGFLFFHMYGNLKIFGGPEHFNLYSEGLRGLGAPLFGHIHLLWVARIGLIVAFVLHVWAALSLYRMARRARPKRYTVYKPVQANSAALTIRYGGLAIFLFIVYHLMHFTWGVSGVHNDFVAGDPYHNVVAGFQSIPVVAIYVIAIVALGLHLYHGTWSMFQTLGFNNRTYDRLLRGVALAVALVISVGFVVVPISVLLRIVR